MINFFYVKQCNATEREKRLRNFTMLDFITEHQNLYNEKQELEDELDNVKKYQRNSEWFSENYQSSFSLSNTLETFVLGNSKKNAKFETVFS